MDESGGSQHPQVKMSWKYSFVAFPLSVDDVTLLGTMRKEVENTEYFHLLKPSAVLSWMVIGV